MSINNSSQLTQPHAIRKIKDSWWPLWDSSLLSWDLNVDANSVSLYNRMKFSICEVTFSIIPGNTYFDLRSFTCSAVCTCRPRPCFFESDGCGSPEIPFNGQVNSTETRADYSCDPGYQLNGDLTRHCRHSRWDGEQPTCKIIYQFKNVTIVEMSTQMLNRSHVYPQRNRLL